MGVEDRRFVIWFYLKKLIWCLRSAYEAMAVVGKTYPSALLKLTGLIFFAEAELSKKEKEKSMPEYS